MLPIDCIQSLACDRNAKHLFENEKQLHYSLIHLTCTVYVQVLSSSIDHCIVLEYVKPGDNVSATCCSVRNLVKNLMFFLNSFFFCRKILKCLCWYLRKEEIQKVWQTFLIEFYHVGSQMRLLVCVSIYGQELYILEFLCCDVVSFAEQKSDRIGDYPVHPILSYIFFLRRQQVMQSALLISSQILLTHPLRNSHGLLL